MKRIILTILFSISTFCLANGSFATTGEHAVGCKEIVLHHIHSLMPTPSAGSLSEHKREGCMIC